jgi:hypothetical protein
VPPRRRWDFSKRGLASSLDRVPLILKVNDHALSNAGRVVLLVSGDDKAEMLQAVLQNPVAHFPASLIRPKDGPPMWLVDTNAARLMVSGRLRS